MKLFNVYSRSEKIVLIDPSHLETTNRYLRRYFMSSDTIVNDSVLCTKRTAYNHFITCSNRLFHSTKTTGYHSISCSHAKMLIMCVKIMYSLFVIPSFHKSCLAFFDFFLIALPYLNSTKGMGMKAIDRKASVDDAQATPRFLYIALANSGCRVISKRSEQRVLCTYEASTKHGPEEIVTSQDTRGILWVSIRQVVEYRIEQQESSH